MPIEELFSELSGKDQATIARRLSSLNFSALKEAGTHAYKHAHESNADPLIGFCIQRRLAVIDRNNWYSSRHNKFAQKYFEQLTNTPGWRERMILAETSAPNVVPLPSYRQPQQDVMPTASLGSSPAFFTPKWYTHDPYSLEEPLRYFSQPAKGPELNV